MKLLRSLRQAPYLRRGRSSPCGRRSQPRTASLLHLLRRLVVGFGIASAAAGCATLPSLEGRTSSSAITDTAMTRLGRELAPDIASHAGKSGVHDLSSARDSFAARVLLATAAARSLDVQYYIWHADEAGELLFEALWKAAQRGVRVRLLLDDNNTRGLDATIAALDAQPNIEVRLYNPFVQRSARGLAFAGDFTRLNRRMHNKSFTADNQLSVVGGRNIGDEYFMLGSGIGFADWDVLLAGPVVQEISQAFDLYWNSASAYPAALIVGPASPDAVSTLEARFAAARADPDSQVYLQSVRETPLLSELRQNKLPFEWTSVTLVYDDPGKTLAPAERKELLLLPDLSKALGEAKTSFDLVSPYFVPGEKGAAGFVALARRGVKVRILTNSLSSSDESVVHAGYAKHRLALVQAGIQIFELKRVPNRTGRPRAGSSSSVALHAKSYAVDRRFIFIGSFNFDQRSAHLNTEMGVVIDSPALAADLAKAIDEKIRLVAYEVRLAPDGESLQWVEWTTEDKTITYDVDPDTSWWLRTKVDVLSSMGLDWLL